MQAKGPTVRLAVIGGGTMGLAIVRGSLDAGVLTRDDIAVCDTDQGKLRPFLDARIFCSPRPADVAARLGPDGQILLAVKPQSLPEVAARLRPALKATPRRVVISILAGTPTETIRRALATPPGEVVVVRAMPNTPARIRRGVTAIAPGAGVTPAEAALATTIFNALGLTIRLDESLMDGFTALAGSGPAYVFYLAEALTAAAREMGLDDATADKAVRGTILGAAALLSEAAEPAAALRAQVASKGGATEAAVAVLDGARVADAVINAVRAGRNRGAELARAAALPA